MAALPVQDAPRPTCNRCQATYVKNEELQAYLKRIPPATMIADQQVRAVNVGKSNVDIGVVYRGKLTGNSPVAEHDQVSEVYHVIDGGGTLVTGPDIADFGAGRQTPPRSNFSTGRAATDRPFEMVCRMN